MTSFNLIPANTRVPTALVEIDASNAQGTPPEQPWKVLLVGQKTSAGTIPALTLTRLFAAADAISGFGAGSELANMGVMAFQAQTFLEMWAIAVPEPGGSVAATGGFSISGAPTATGNLCFYISGRRFQVPVSLASTPTTIAAALVTAIQAETNCPANSTASVGVVSVAAKCKGTIGNEIDLRINYNPGETIPLGLAVAIAPMANGAGDATISAIWPLLGDVQYNALVIPVTDATNLTAIEKELDDRWGPIRHCAGGCFTASSAGNWAGWPQDGSGVGISQFVALCNSRNSPYVSILSTAGEPTPTWEKATAAAMQAAFSSSIDPALPWHTLPLVGILPAAPGNRLTVANENAVLLAGGSVTYVDDGGIVRWLRGISTYKTNALGVPDLAFFDFTTIFLVDRLAFDFRVYMSSKYARSKIMQDATRVASGQSILTPALGLIELVSLARRWEARGWVEDVETFKKQAVVEINPTDRTRMDFFMPPNLVNGLGLMAAKLSFKL